MGSANLVVAADDKQILELATRLFGYSLGAPLEGSYISEIRPSLQAAYNREFLVAEIDLADGRKISKEVLDLPRRIR